MGNSPVRLGEPMETHQKYTNESLPQIVHSEPIVKAKLVNMSLVTCSPDDVLTELEKHVPAIEEIAQWSANQVHQCLGDALLEITTNYRTARNLVAELKRRFQLGEVVGGCNTWKSYVDTYIRKED